MKLYGETFSRRRVLQSVGDLSQLADIREGILTAGRADGMRVLDVKTGSGLNFSVFPSRAMDIGWAEYKGRPLAHISKSGIVKPEFYEKDSRSFLRSFSCGLLTSCGLTQMGTPCEVDGEQLGLHGRLSNIPAFDVFADKRWEGDEYVMELGGKVRESRIFGENLQLSRVLKTSLGSRTISITDTVTNFGFQESPLMLLYHINMGYPLISANSEMRMSIPSTITPRDDAAAAGLDHLWQLQNPTPSFAKQVFFHELESSCATCKVAVFNKALSYGILISFPTVDFPHLCHWKMMGEGDYVLGIEPCTAPPIGRKRAMDRGILPVLGAQETREFHLQISLLDDHSEFDQAFE